MRTMILGIGNLLMGDDGLGPHVVRVLSDDRTVPSNVLILDGGTGGMNLLPQLKGVTHLIIVDAIDAGQPPASLIYLDGTQVPSFFKTKLSPHQMGIADVLADLAFENSYPPRVAVIGVQPLSLSPQIGLSPEVLSRVPEVISLVLSELAVGKCSLQLPS